MGATISYGPSFSPGESGMRWIQYSLAHRKAARTAHLLGRCGVFLHLQQPDAAVGRAEVEQRAARANHAVLLGLSSMVDVEGRRWWP